MYCIGGKGTNNLSRRKVTCITLNTATATRLLCIFSINNFVCDFLHSESLIVVFNMFNMFNMFID